MTSPFVAPERDRPIRFGRPKPSGGSTPFSIPGVIRGTDGAFSPASNTDYYAPVVVSAPILVDQLAFEVTTLEAAKNGRCGIYVADTDFQPVGAPLADSGDISIASTGLKTYTPGTPLYLPRGRYLTVYNQNSATAALRSYQGNIAIRTLDPALGAAKELLTLTVGRTYAAFPTPGTAWTTATYGSVGMHNLVVMRISTP